MASMASMATAKELEMDKFIIGPHMRLQEWVADEKGYFKDEGLACEFVTSTGLTTPSVQSGSHYTTIQALEPILQREEIKVHFGGTLFLRLELLIDREVPVATLFSGPMYVAEQLGFRKILDCSFMTAATVREDTSEEDVL